MTLLRDIQDEAASGSASVAALLRRAPILAFRLGHDPLKHWTRLELEGYPSTEGLPPYRTVREGQLPVVGEFVSPQGILSGVELSPTRLPNDLATIRRELFSVFLLSGVAEFEALLATDYPEFPIPWTASQVGALQVAWPGLSSAHRRVPRNTYANVLDQVRNRILEFSLEIEQRDPAAGEAQMDAKQIPESVVTNIFNNTIFGDSAVVTNAGRDATVSADQTEIGAAWPDVRAELEAMGLPSAEINALEVAVRSDGDRGGEIGPATQSWLGGLATKLASGVITVGGDIDAVQRIVHLISSIF